jgi:hypothetical protein
MITTKPGRAHFFVLPPWLFQGIGDSQSSQSEFHFPQFHLGITPEATSQSTVRSLNMQWGHVPRDFDQQVLGLGNLLPILDHGLGKKGIELLIEEGTCTDKQRALEQYQSS